MTHPSHDTLWAWAQHSDEAPQVVGAHVESCPQCASAVADIRVAQQVLASLPPVPPMPDALAHRVGVALAEKADRQFLARWGRWWSGFLSPRWLVATAAAILAVVVVRALGPEGPAPVSPSPLAAKVVAPPSEGPKELPSKTSAKEVAVAPAPPPLKRALVTASVAMAKKARAHDRPVEKAQVLQEGAMVATEAGGSLWMQLGDGTRAGLTGSTQVTLARMEEKAVRFDVAQGSLAMVVPHREDRVVTVQAGEVEVMDLGTRFLVSRSDGRVLVAVEEGAVEVKTPTTTRKVVAGHAASWHDGRLDSLAWEVPAPPRRQVAPAATEPASPQPSSVARLEEEQVDDEADVTEAPPESDAESDAASDSVAPPPMPPASMEEEWAKLPPPPGRVPTPMPPGKPRSRFDLSGLEERLRELQTALQAPFRPNELVREARMREVTLRVDRGDCRTALVFAERWLRQPATRRAEEPMWRRSVMTQKWRCLLKQGRVDEAGKVQRQLDAQP